MSGKLRGDVGIETSFSPRGSNSKKLTLNQSFEVFANACANAGVGESKSVPPHKEKFEEVLICRGVRRRVALSQNF